MTEKLIKRNKRLIKKLKQDLKKLPNPNENKSSQDSKIKKLNFGCGEKIMKGFDNWDIQKEVETFGGKQVNFDIFPYPAKDNTYDLILAYEILEHTKDPERVLLELRRISKPNAIIDVHVPHYTNKGSYTSMQHKYHFSDMSFINFVNDFHRLDTTPKFEIIELINSPTSVGKYIYPKWFREKLSLFFMGIFARVECKLKVLKNDI